MDYRFSSEQDINQSCETISFAYLHYRAETPAKCDLSFRKFVTTSVFDGAILVPVRSGPGRKLTLEGVVKIAATTAMPVKTPYKDTVLAWTPITEFIFERYRKESATKIYFRGFPLEATQAQIASVFNEYGPLQYVYIMCESSFKKRTNKQGYVIFESRQSVERLFSQKTTLGFNGFPIHIEEYKSKNSNLMKDILSGNSTSKQEILERSPCKSQDNLSILPETVYETPTICSRSPYFNPLTRDCSQTNSLSMIRSSLLKKSAFSLTNIEKKGPVDKNSGLRQYLRFASKVEANCQETNLRFNKRSRLAPPARHL